VTDFNGKDFDMKSRDILGTNARTHQGLLDMLNDI
jgi:hypothetical protein